MNPTALLDCRMLAGFCANGSGMCGMNGCGDRVADPIEISNLFFAKLARSRGKSQYLRMQASTLAPAHPEVALEVGEKGIYQQRCGRCEVSASQSQPSIIQLSLTNV